MPNQRASNKRQFGVTLTVEELKAIDEAAKKMQVTRTEFIRLASLKLLQKEAQDPAKEDPDRDA